MAVAPHGARGASGALRLRLLLLVALCSEVARLQAGGFPCAEYEWVAATWHPPHEAECHSCYECDLGQECRRRGGCFNCTEGEYDTDGEPMHPCEECPEGKSSEEAATECTEESWSESLHAKKLVERARKDPLGSMKSLIEMGGAPLTIPTGVPSTFVLLKAGRS
jgi:hypothetical protein